MEPYRKKRWGYSGTQLDLYSCARPGRSKGPDGVVADSIVLDWLEGLPKGEKTTIISLLGTKPDGKSEYSFYSFDEDTFEEWIAKKGFTIGVVRHPTKDFSRIPNETLESNKTSVINYLKEGHTVILVDSGGITRSGAVFRYIGFSEDSRSI